MAGKRTDLNGRHRTRSGGFAEPFALTRPTIDALTAGLSDDDKKVRFALLDEAAKTITRDLAQSLGTKAERIDAQLVEDAIKHWRGVRFRSLDGHASRQDMLRTLRGMASDGDDSRLATSYRQCDALTRAELQSAMVALGNVTRDSMRRPTPAMIREAASMAVETLSSRSAAGGRPLREYQRGFARACLELWEQMGGDHRASIWQFECSNAEPSPLLRFAGTLFTALEGKPFDLAKVKRLLVEARRGNVSAPS